MELNPFAWEFHEDPYPTYRWLRDHAPLYRNEAMRFWALSRFRDVMGAFVDWETYSSVGGLVLEKLDPAHLEITPMMIFMDPPRHDRLRKLVSRAFTPRRIAALEPFVARRAARLLDPLVARGGGDFVADFSTPLPMDVIFTLLGVPEADRRQLREWIDLSLARDPGTDAIPPRAIEAGIESACATGSSSSATARVTQRRPDLQPVRRRAGDRRRPTTRLTDGEIIGFCSLLGAAGSETTTRLLAFAAVLFARHPEQYDRGSWRTRAPSRAPSRRSCAGRRRRSTPSGRITRDVEWYGRTVPAGDRILLLLGAANRDEREYPDPDRFDIGRDVPTQLGFGQGVHYCLGASLARLESPRRAGGVRPALPPLSRSTRRAPARAHEQRAWLRVPALRRALRVAAPLDSRGDRSHFSRHSIRVTRRDRRGKWNTRPRARE